jgi:hypothetical protein
LQISEDAAEIEFDCARGAIRGAIPLDEQGRFEVPGSYVRERPGPIRVGDEPKQRPASYAGSIRDQTMTLRVTLTDSKESIGTFSLQHGSGGTVRKCR